MFRLRVPTDRLTMVTQCAAAQLDMACTVFLPEGATPTMLRRLKDEGAIAKEVGKDYFECLAAAEKYAADNEDV